MVYSTVGLCAGLKIRNESWALLLGSEPDSYDSGTCSLLLAQVGALLPLNHNHSFLPRSVPWNQGMGDRAARWHLFLLQRMAEGWDSGISLSPAVQSSYCSQALACFLLLFGVVLHCTPGQALPQCLQTLSGCFLKLPLARKMTHCDFFLAFLIRIWSGGLYQSL